MQCSHCGRELPENSESCSACGQALANPSSEQESSQSGIIRRKAVYAGFWFRAVAFVFDSLILDAALALTILKPILESNHIASSPRAMWNFYTGGTRQAIAFNLLIQVAFALYCATFEGSSWQATPGKKLLGLVVTDLEGKRLTFLRAALRSFAMMISQFTLLIGFLMAGFTSKKQALHDMIAGCLVLRKI